MLNKEIQEKVFFAIISKCLKRKTIKTEDRKEIWMNLAKFYLKRNPPELAILTYQGHKSLIPINTLMVGKQKRNSPEIWDEISHKNNMFLDLEEGEEQVEKEEKKESSQEEETLNISEIKESDLIQDEEEEENKSLKDSQKKPDIEGSKTEFKYLIDLSGEREESSVKSVDSSKPSLKRKLTNVNQGNIDVQMIEQIRIDVIRTKQWKNSDYHELLKSLIIKFIIRYESKLEYFQGFNYITSFLLDMFSNQEECLLILDYVKDILLEDFFFDNLCPKLSLLHFQINHMVRHHYPLLHAKWKNNEILSEVLFSSFIISLFTSFVIEEQGFIQDFWDIILIEKWEGVIKILLFLVEIFYEDIIKMDGNDTMKFFSEMKSEPYILKKVKKFSVKDFVNNLNFNSDFLVESKRLFLSIERKNIE